MIKRGFQWTVIMAKKMLAVSVEAAVNECAAE